MRPVVGVLSILLSAQVLAAPPQVGEEIPADVVWVAILERPGEVLREFGTKLELFKNLNPDFDWTKLGAQVQAATGQNLLTAEGLSAFGIDPSGSHALFSLNFEQEPVAAIALLDATKFLESFKAALPKEGSQITEEKPVGPAKVYKAGNTFLAIAGKSCLLLPQREPNTIEASINAILGKGKKLAANPAFLAAYAGVGIEPALSFYMPMAAIEKHWVKSQDERAKAAPNTARDIRRVRDRFAGILKQVEALSAAIRTEPAGLKLGFFLKLAPAGQKNFGEILPASAPPASHEGLARAAIAGGWLSVRALPLVEWLSGLPVSETQTLEVELKQAQKAFRDELGLDLMKDFLGNLREPVAAYWLTPDLSGLKGDAPVEAQVLNLLRILVHVRLDKPALFEKLLAKVEEAQKAQGLALEVALVDGAKVRTIRPHPLVPIDFALAGNTLVMGFGDKVVAPALKSVTAETPGASVGELRGVTFFDFAAFNEVATGAVQKGIGGQQGFQFRMMWPLVQQVLGRFTKLEAQGSLNKVGLQATVSIGLR